MSKLDKSWSSAKRRSLRNIVARIITINTLYYGTIFVHFVLFLNQELESSSLLGVLTFPMMIVWLGVAHCEIRLVDSCMYRVFGVVGNISMYYKLACFGIVALVGYLSNSRKLILWTILIECVLLAFWWIVVHLVYKDKIKYVVVDWLKVYVRKPNDNIESIGKD